MLYRLAGAAIAAGCIYSSALAAADDDANDLRIRAFETEVVDIADADDPATPRWSIAERLAHHGVPGAGVAVIRNGEIALLKGYGVKRAGGDALVDANTVFSVGSISKMINAALILRMAAEGLVDLDEDVNAYLASWKVPENRHTRQNKVTLRAILSHTAGFSQHGFADFQPGEDLPSAIETLNGVKPAKHDAVRLMFTPGEKMDYSGGGTTVSQILVEDVTGLAYPEAVKKYVFDPLGMTRSTFVNPLPASHGNIARAHNELGAATALPRGWEAMPEMAASGLWTSAADLAAFVIALQKSYDGDGSFLPQPLAADMMTRVPRSWHGLGPRLNGEGETLVFHHGGANESYHAWLQGHLASGDGIVVLTNGARGYWIHRELRISAERAFDWPMKVEDGFEEPEF